MPGTFHDTSALGFASSGGRRSCSSQRSDRVYTSRRHVEALELHHACSMGKRVGRFIYLPCGAATGLPRRWLPTLRSVANVSSRRSRTDLENCLSFPSVSTRAGLHEKETRGCLSPTRASRLSAQSLTHHPATAILNSVLVPVKAW